MSERRAVNSLGGMGPQYLRFLFFFVAVESHRRLYNVMLGVLQKNVMSPLLF